MAKKVGFFHIGSKESFNEHYEAFKQGMNKTIERLGGGLVVENIAPKWAADSTEKTPVEHVADLTESGAEVIVAAGGPPAALAAQEAVRGTVPVVFMSVADPVDLELVVSLDRPGKNMTGIAGLTSELDVKRLELLRELLVGGEEATIGVLNNRNRPHLEKQYKVLFDAAYDLDLRLVRRDVADLNEIGEAFKEFKGDYKVDAVLVTADSMFNNLRKEVVKLAKGMPAIYQWREFAEAGGLMSFGPNIFDAYAKVGEYAALVLKEGSASNLAVSLPNRFELVINLREAYDQGFKIPASLLSRAQLV
jgi:putative ABC transport system substrate-binding protein